MKGEYNIHNLTELPITTFYCQIKPEWGEFKKKVLILPTQSVAPYHRKVWLHIDQNLHRMFMKLQVPGDIS